MLRPSAILNLLISEFLSRFRRLGKVCVCILNMVKFGRFAAEIWRHNDFQNGGRSPCWMYCDVIIMYRMTEFNAYYIVTVVTVVTPKGPSCVTTCFELHMLNIFLYL